MSFVRVKHADHGGEWDCPAAYLDAAFVNGWRPLDESGPHGETADYSTRSRDALWAEIDSRNSDRDESDRISKGGSKAELVDRLLADDARSTD